MFFARFFLCVLLAAFFAAVILSATTIGSGEYSAAVSAEANYCGEAHNTKCYYSVREKRWFMKIARTMEGARADDDKGSEGNDSDLKKDELDDPNSLAPGRKSSKGSPGGNGVSNGGPGTSVSSHTGPQDSTVEAGGNVEGSGGSSRGAASPPESSTGGSSGDNLPEKAERLTGINNQGSRPTSTSGTPENSQKNLGAAGSGAGNSGSGSTEAPGKKDDPQKAKGDKQSSTTPQPPTTAPSSSGKNTATSSTVSETTSDAANMGIIAPVRERFVYLLLFLLLSMLWHVSW